VHQRRWIGDVASRLNFGANHKNDNFEYHSDIHRRYLLPIILFFTDIVLISFTYMLEGVQLNWVSVSVLLAVTMTLALSYRVIRSWPAKNG
jgi:hypothetical protein